MELFHYSGPAELCLITDVRNRISHVLACCRQPPHVAQNLQLLASEAIANIVEHSQPRASWIEARLCQSAAAFEFSLTSDGGAFDGSHFDLEGAVADARSENPCLDRIGGRGLFLIGALADTVCYQPGAINRLTMSYRVDEPKRHLLLDGRQAYRAVGPLLEGYELILAASPAQIKPLRTIFTPVARLSLDSADRHVTITGLTTGNAGMKISIALDAALVQRAVAIIAALGAPSAPDASFQPASA